nr:MAG TPA: hypothetical protein [Caudoviricetes sp.]
MFESKANAFSIIVLLSSDKFSSSFPSPLFVASLLVVEGLRPSPPWLKDRGREGGPGIAR